MPNLSTPVAISQTPHLLTHRDGVILTGSCFSDNIGEKLRWYGFDVVSNPFGVVYNPLSVNHLLRRAMANQPVDAGELKGANELWYHHHFHSSFSGTNQEQVLQAMNEAIGHTHLKLKSASQLIITWGTAWVYRLRENGQIVANCHKLPEREFAREFLSPAAIADDCRQLQQQLADFNPSLQIVLTISPVRHLRDGATGNQVSKASLFLAMQKCIEQQPDTAYFPAYEIMMDELRDYRFYADDMVHPSALAVEFIWEKFAESRIATDTRKLFPAIDKIQRGLRHRPFNADTAIYKKFYADLKQQALLLEQQVPGLKLV